MKFSSKEWEEREESQSADEEHLRMNVSVCMKNGL